jgi:hypothetical protein
VWYLQVQRLRLISEGDLKLEAAEAALREERRRGEAALEAAQHNASKREAAVREEVERWVVCGSAALVCALCALPLP